MDFFDPEFLQDSHKFQRIDHSYLRTKTGFREVELGSQRCPMQRVPVR